MRQAAKQQAKCHNQKSSECRVFGLILLTYLKNRTVSEELAPYGAKTEVQNASVNLREKDCLVEMESFSRYHFPFPICHFFLPKFRMPNPLMPLR